MDRFKKCFLFLLFLTFLQRGEATEYQPWVGNYLEFEWRNSLLYQGYSYVSTGSHLEKYSTGDLFFHTSLSNALKPELSIEIEAVAARTRHQRGNIDHIKGTGRYVWQDDIAGDPLTLTTGLSFSLAFKRSVHDISSFHHGRGETELFLSAGKEWSKGTEWDSRVWGVFGVGGALEKGSPWIRFQLAYEKQLAPLHQLQGFMKSLWGLGHHSLHIHCFHGYGPIQHQSIDLGLRYTYVIEYFGSASLEYSYRVHARNFPAYVHHVLLQVLYTFGL